MAPAFYFPLIGTPTAEGNRLSFFEAGLDVPLDVWTDSDLTLPWSQPIILNAAGESDGPIYVSSSPSYKVVYTDANGIAIPGYPVDFVSPSTIVNVMTTSTTTLTDAQIKALPTTPITLVAAPASGLRVKPFACSFRTAFTAGAYTNINTTTAALQLQTPTADLLSCLIMNDSSLTVPLTKLTTFFNAAQLRLVDVPIPFMEAIDAGSVSGTTGIVKTGISTTPAHTNGVALQLAIDNNGSGALTGGNAANTLTVTLYYALESVS
jgi:hypothetical protein